MKWNFENIPIPRDSCQKMPQAQGLQEERSHIRMKLSLFVAVAVAVVVVVWSKLRWKIRSAVYNNYLSREGVIVSEKVLLMCGRY